MSEGLFLERLKLEHIQEKLDLNAKDGRDIFFMQNAITEERKEFMLMVIRKKGMVVELGIEIEKLLRSQNGAPEFISKEIDRLTIERHDFVWQIIQNEIQVQCYTEQLEYINKKVDELKAVTDGRTV